jgi:hypothetical protein
MFKALVKKVCLVLENCGNLTTDEDVQDALCKAAEEIGRKVLPDLDLGCTPGYTPTPDPCAGNVAAPVISSVLIDGNPVSVLDTVNVVVGVPYVVTVNASDPDGILGTITYSASVNGVNPGPFSLNQITITPLAVGEFTVYVNVSDGCATKTWGPVTVVVHDECFGNDAPSLTMPEDANVDPNPVNPYTWSVTATDDGIKDPLSFTLISVDPVPSNNFSVDATSGEISWDPDCSDIIDRANTIYTVTIEVTDGCDPVQGSFEVTLNAEPCLCIGTDLSIFSLEIKEGSTWHEYLGAFDPDTTVYHVVTAGNASHFRFTATAECADDAVLEYNWYRGAQCGDSWLTGEIGYSDPPSTWISITSGGTYPADTNDRPVCNKGGNVLFVKVTNGLDEKIYKVYVDRP